MKYILSTVGHFQYLIVLPLYECHSIITDDVHYCHSMPELKVTVHSDLAIIITAILRYTDIP